MKPDNSTAQRKEIKVSIGQESMTYQPEYKKSLDLELLIINLILYALIFAFGLNYISIPVFMVLFYCIGMRAFMGNHDRMHTNHRKRNPKWFEVFTEYFWVVVTPWDEPYDSIKKKHYTHHTTHASGKVPKFDSKADPHSVFEMGGVIRVFLSCLFYEEIQLYIDIRDKRLTRSRFYKFLIYTPLIILFIITFGWMKFLIVFSVMRLIGVTAWFIFSWAFHQSFLYQFEFSRNIPKWLVYVNTFLFGRRIANGTMSHAVHHAWPSIPFDQLKKFDMAAFENHNHAPDMRPSSP
jgi:fatty acid desaturase